VLASLQGFEDDVLGERRATHHLNHHVDLRVLEDRVWIAGDLTASRDCEIARLIDVANDNLCDLRVDAEG